MKQLLILLSSLTTLTLASNVSLKVANNTTINNKLNNTPDVQTPASLFNNTFGCLNQGSWITNQATTDNKYYSYDTSHAVGNLSDGTPSRNAFIVDSTGSLTINSKLKLSDADKNMLNNIQQEMISHKQVTSIKNDYDAYSKSIYNDSYFSGDNSSWKYLQMGGVENRIDISSQQSANKVEHSNSLSETLGLYYIAKAECTPGGIDKAVADSLGKYFISKSSLKNLDDNLTNSVINIIATNTNVYNLILQVPPRDGESTLYKNYSTNYIFDSNNNLIEVYYHQWNNDNIQKSINYGWDKYYDVWNSNDHSNIYTLLNWKQYASNWDNFTTLYPNFNFNNNSYLEVSSGDDHKVLDSLNTDTKKILENQGSGNTNSVFKVEIELGLQGGADLDLDIWRDSENIVFKWFYWATNLNINVNVHLNNIVFNNIMN